MAPFILIQYFFSWLRCLFSSLFQWLKGDVSSDNNFFSINALFLSLHYKNFHLVYGIIDTTQLQLLLVNVSCSIHRLLRSQKIPEIYINRKYLLYKITKIFFFSMKIYLKCISAYRDAYANNLESENVIKVIVLRSHRLSSPNWLYLGVVC